MIPILLFIASIIAAIIHLSRKKKPRKSKGKIEIFLAYMIPLNIGVMGIIAFIAHSFYGPQTASMIGFAPNHPFQNEVAIANLGFGVLGLLCLWQRKGCWLATVLGNTIFILGCAISYIVVMSGGKGDNAHSFLFYINDIVIPIILFLLTCLYCNKNRFFKS